MRIAFSSEIRGNNPLFELEIDPARVRGTRSTFGPQLHVGVQVVFNAGHQPILFEGEIKWPGEGGGAVIPLQSIGRGTAELVVALSDHQVAAIERTRAGRESNFELTLRAIGIPDDPGTLGRYTTNFIPQLQVPRDVWKRALNGFGVGIVRIVELPSPAPGLGEAWARAFELLDEASHLLSEGRYGEAVATARTVLERIAESVGEQNGYPRDNPAFSNYVEELAKRLKSRRNGDDPFALIGQLIRTANGWTSHPVHQGFDVSERDDAIFAVNLCVALYSYLARAAMPNEQAATE